MFFLVVFLVDYEPSYTLSRSCWVQVKDIMHISKSSLRLYKIYMIFDLDQDALDARFKVYGLVMTTNIEPNYEILL